MEVTVKPAGYVVQLRPNERILDGFIRLGYQVPYSCRNGNCNLCTATIIQGRAQCVAQTYGARQTINTCRAIAVEDIILNWDSVLAPNELPVSRVFCQLTDIQALDGDVFRVQLLPPAGKPVRYFAGQYALVEREDGEVAAFSIASAPHQARYLELHILARDNAPQALLAYISAQQGATLSLPHGNVHSQQLAEDKPLLLIAAGTGMAQMHSILEHYRALGAQQPIHLYWGARQEADFYHVPNMDTWLSLPNLHYHKIVSHDQNWLGRKGLLFEAICEDIPQLEQYQVVVSGSPAMVYATQDALVAAGMRPEQMLSDVFAYAPRKPI
ncbi:2Fe-2S iron-sulfur cluster-binding protein [Thiopseudomonas alkaliphila]|uniref:2Fe-2S iron-sulfur cluster-binding protein n=1 Tax=Thiopseudomonas alkaliphila TaxID=1697053 RepID=UPI00357112C7